MRVWSNAEADLRTEIAGKTAGRGNYSGFDLYLLRFTIQFLDQAIDSRNHTRNILNDHRVRAIVGDDISPLGKKGLQGWNDIFRGTIAQVPRHRNTIYGKRLSFLGGANRFSFLAQSFR